ncbi:MAG: DRTGG domain-containing protein [SAR202 cluster bacterium]|nr:DRTGG domain-containing protein [SAR202 cluster bacterium]
MAVLYVASDLSGTGKTALSASLASILAEGGLSVGVIKPLAGPDDTDVSAYADLLGASQASPPLAVPADGISPTIADAVQQSCDAAKDGKDVLIVEGASDLSQKDHAKLADALDAAVVIVAGFSSDMDADSLSGWSEQMGDRLLGFVINGITRYQDRYVTMELLPEMEVKGLKSLGTLPEDRRLLGVTVSQVAEHLNGRYLAGEALTDGLVEHFMVGGMGLDSGLEYFGLHDNKATIIRGDRPDIQMSSLQTPTTCMVLTEGKGPTEYVLNEAELEDVPIVVTDSDTLTTMKTLNGVQNRARFNHPAKLDRFSELLRRHADLDTIRTRLATVS